MGYRFGVLVDVVVPAVVLVFAIATGRAHQKRLLVLAEREKLIRDLLQKSSARADELASARDAALRAAQAKGNFVAVMSHEIRTPLNAVLGFAGMLLDSPLSPEQAETARMIRSSGDTLLALVNDILDFSKIEAGRLTLEEAPFDIGDSIEDTIDLFAAAAVEKDIDLSGHLTLAVPSRIRGDAARVGQILANFLSNAMKFTPRGSIEVHADATKRPGVPDGIEIHCWVRDTGIGIPKGRLDQLFDAFTQADSSTTRRFGGTGLGLAICRSIAERMGGRVWAESEEGAGSTFHLSFPSLMLPETETSEIRIVRPSGPVVLIVSRDGTRRSLSDKLMRLGLHVLNCGDTPAVISALKTEKASVVVVDEGMATEGLRKALLAMEPPPATVLLSHVRNAGHTAKDSRIDWPGALHVSLPARRLFLREALLVACGQSAAKTSSCSVVDSNAPKMATDWPLRILVAEDNPVNQKMMQMLLDRLGYRADFVGNGIEALEAVKARQYDVVLMDMRMPEMDGPEATRRIRAEVRRESQPRIVALTANTSQEDRAHCLDAGMEDFLTKPLVTANLVNALRATVRLNSRSRISTTGENEVLDELRRVTDGDPGLLRELVDLYLDTTARLMAELSAALSASNATSVASVAHSLKGSAAQVGASSVVQHAAAMEQAARRGDLEEAKGKLSALELAQAKISGELTRACLAP